MQSSWGLGAGWKVIPVTRSALRCYFEPVLAPKFAEAARKLRGSRIFSCPPPAHADGYQGAGFCGSSAEAESTYQPSAEAETVVAEAARKTARKTSKIIRELHRGFRHRSVEPRVNCWDSESWPMLALRKNRLAACWHRFSNVECWEVCLSPILDPTCLQGADSGCAGKKDDAALKCAADFSWLEGSIVNLRKNPKDMDDRMNQHMRSKSCTERCKVALDLDVGPCQPRKPDTMSGCCPLAGF